MLKDWKSKNLITPADCLRYGRSEHVQNIIHKLEKLHGGTVNAKDFSKIEVTHVRNFIMVILCVTNAARDCYSFKDELCRLHVLPLYLVILIVLSGKV